MKKENKYKEFAVDIEYLKLLEKRLAKVEYPDIALSTYYHNFEPSSLVSHLIYFLENNDS